MLNSWCVIAGDRALGTGDPALPVVDSRLLHVAPSETCTPGTPAHEQAACSTLLEDTAALLSLADLTRCLSPSEEQLPAWLKDAV